MRHKIGSPPHDKTAFAMGALWGNKSPPVRFIGGKSETYFFLKGALYGKKEEKRAV